MKGEFLSPFCTPVEPRLCGVRWTRVEGVKWEEGEREKIPKVPVQGHWTGSNRAGRAGVRESAARGAGLMWMAGSLAWDVEVWGGGPGHGPSPSSESLLRGWNESVREVSVLFGFWWGCGGAIQAWGRGEARNGPCLMEILKCFPWL